MSGAGTEGSSLRDGLPRHCLPQPAAQGFQAVWSAPQPKPDPRVLSVHLWLILALGFIREAPLEGWAVPQEHITPCML